MIAASTSPSVNFGSLILRGTFLSAYSRGVLLFWTIVRVDWSRPQSSSKRVDDDLLAGTTVELGAYRFASLDEADVICGYGTVALELEDEAKSSLETNFTRQSCGVGKLAHPLGWVGCEFAAVVDDRCCSMLCFRDTTDTFVTRHEKDCHLMSHTLHL
jgi:hypothetical protein